CGRDPTAPGVRRAAALVRHAAADLDTTYELSLAILFLDRLGEPSDEKLIQTFALRLVAGQAPTGGWGYKCPKLAPGKSNDLLTTLQKLNPKMPTVVGPGGDPLNGTTTGKPGGPGGTVTGPG